jgi:hypothetical protein
MKGLVNFGKRSVQLPAGCKDLIDLIEPSKRRRVSTFTTHPAQGMKDIGKHLSGLLEPGAKCKNLVITWHEKNYLHLMNVEGVLTALVIVHENTGREQAIRVFFAKAGLAPLLDEAVAGWSVRMLRYPLPERASKIEQLVFSLLRAGYGLAENVRLEFGSFS